jgi:hypothetical protein
VIFDLIKVKNVYVTNAKQGQVFENFVPHRPSANYNDSSAPKRFLVEPVN